LTQVPAGGWIDRLDEHGRPATDVMPASTLYHVMCAIDELDRFANGYRLLCN
jgi:mannose-6-phosphate isomerase